MRRHRSSLSLRKGRFPQAVAVATCAIALACTEPTEVEVDGPRLSVSLEAPPRDVLPGEAHLFALADEDPTFAGVLYEGGRRIVLGTDGSRLSGLSDRVASHASAAAVQLGRQPDAMPSEGRVVRYSFLELNAWREELFARIWGWEEIFSIDLNEGQNILTVGVEADGVPRLQELMQKLEIPADAWRPEIGVPDRPSNKVTDRQRPTQAGTGLKYHISPNDWGCTLGVNAKLSGRMVFLTSSHCSFGAYNLSTHHAQAQGPVVGAVIGHEWKDPAGWDCSSWIPFTQTSSNCRNADVAAYDYSIPDDSVMYGYIARHDNRHQGAIPNQPEPTYDETNPLEIIGIASVWAIGQGAVVEKIGRKTGWTYGTVTETCSRKKVTVSHGSGHYTVLCAYSTNYHAERGDSGGPVFLLGGSDKVYFAGLHYGSDDNDNGRFSDWASIQTDLGSMSIYDPPPPPLGASIGGNNLVPEYAYCTWQGSGSGGTPPYSFSWSGVLSGSGTNISGTVHSSGWLYLTVTDAASNTAGAQMYITVDEHADECVE